MLASKDDGREVDKGKDGRFDAGEVVGWVVFDASPAPVIVPEEGVGFVANDGGGPAVGAAIGAGAALTSARFPKRAALRYAALFVDVRFCATAGSALGPATIVVAGTEIGAECC